MFPEANTIASGPDSDNSGGNNFLESLADLIGALGDATSNVIGALRSGQSGGVVTVTTPPTATASIAGLDLTTIVIIGLAVWFIARQ